MIGTIRSGLARTVAMTLVLAVVLPAAGAAQARAPATPEGAGITPSPSRAVTSAATSVDVDFGRLPLYFVENRGQTDSRVAYTVLGGATQVYFTADGVTFALSESDAGNSRGPDGRGEAFPERLAATTRFAPGGSPGVADDLVRNASPLRDDRDDAAPRQRWAVKLDFVGATPQARPVGEDQTKAVVSYFRGAPDRWHAGLPTYARVVHRDLWPGIDLAFYGQAGRLKYDFLVHPGADPAQIRLRYRGAEGVSLNAAGQMEVTTPLGGFTDDAPVAWQEIDGERVPVTVAYDLSSSQPTARRGQLAISNPQSFGFHIAPYDGTQPLVIDPLVLVYCGYIGGAGSERGGIAVDRDGNAYVAGNTYSTEETFPVIGGPDLTYNGGWVDAFIAKVSPSGESLLYAGYIGGSGDDSGYDIAVDGAGNAYVTGSTDSDQATFPVTGGPDVTHNGGYDAFVAKVSASGEALVYAGYIGGAGYDDSGADIAVDGAGYAYVTGSTDSDQATFPVTGGPDPTYNGAGDYGDAFVAKVSASGTALVYAGYIGGSGDDYGSGIAVDGASNAYVAGRTGSTQSSFPVAGGPDPTHNGGTDAFVAKVNSSGAALVYAGYIGGWGNDGGKDIAVDGTGNAYVTGETDSAQSSFPVTWAPDLTHNGGTDAFVAKVSASGAGLVYASYIGGAGGDHGWGIAVDGTGNAYVTGYTTSDQDSFPVTGGPDLTFNGGVDAFVAKVGLVGLDKYTYLPLVLRGN